jgi:putative iron-only hydrogenase system regulator
MEKKIGTISIVVLQREVVSEVNALLSNYAAIIHARQGIPLHEDGLFVISLVVKSDADTINALTGKLGKLKGIKVKSILLKSIEH